MRNEYRRSRDFDDRLLLQGILGCGGTAALAFFSAVYVHSADHALGSMFLSVAESATLVGALTVLFSVARSRIITQPLREKSRD